MKTICITAFLICCLTISVNSFGQSTLYKIGSGISQAQQAGDTYGKLKGLFAKKKKQQDTLASTTPTPIIAPVTPPKVNDAAKITLITIKGIEFSKLKAFADNIKTCQGVDSTIMKFSADVSVIKVMHSGSTDMLLEEMERTSKDIFSEKNIESFEEGSIIIKL